jgi:transcriptional regulator with XRE-family HTH domain
MFDKNLKFLREKFSMEQIELAHKLGRKSSSSISEWEKGKYTPNFKTLSEIADIFNVDLDDLMNQDLSKTNQSKQEDISKTLDSILDQLSSKNLALMFDGEELDDETRELLISSLKNSYEMAKKLTKSD